MTPTVVVPVKSGRKKSRLSGLLAAPEREEFSRLLLVGVLRALREARLIGSTYVVSSDRRVLAIALRSGSKAVSEPNDVGVNGAVARALTTAGKVEDVLVIPSDLPLIRGADLLHLIRIKSQGVDAVIAPSLAFDGTNALLYGPHSGFNLSYDDDSFWNHLVSLARNGLATGVCTDRGLTFDVDTPDDFRALGRLRSSRPPAEFARKKLL